MACPWRAARVRVCHARRRGLGAARHGVCFRCQSCGCQPSVRRQYRVGIARPSIVCGIAAGVRHLTTEVLSEVDFLLVTLTVLDDEEAAPRFASTCNGPTRWLASPTSCRQVADRRVASFVSVRDTSGWDSDNGAYDTTTES